MKKDQPINRLDVALEMRLLSRITLEAKNVSYRLVLTCTAAPTFETHTDRWFYCLGDGQPKERKHLNTYDPDAERSRGNSNSLRHTKNTGRPGSALSGRSGKQGMPTPSGDVSEFSFQLK